MDFIVENSVAWAAINEESTMWNLVRNWMTKGLSRAAAIKTENCLPMSSPWDMPACWRQKLSGDRLH